MTIQDPTLNRPRPVAGVNSSAISAARASDLFDLLVAGTKSGGAAALAYIAYKTAFDGRWLLHLSHNPFSLNLIGLIALAFGGFRIVAMAYDSSPTGGIMHRSRAIQTRPVKSRSSEEIEPDIRVGPRRSDGL